MFRISKLTDYALLIMSELARAPTAVRSTTELAGNLSLSLPTVSKILKKLCEKKLVSSVRGHIGGYHLARAPEKITVAQIIAVMEARTGVTECTQKNSRCVLNSKCALRENWRRINGMVEALLSSFTLVDMLKPISLTEVRHGK